MKILLLTVREVAKQLRVNRAFVYEAIKRGDLASVNVGSTKVRLTALEQFIEERENKR